MDIKKTTTFFLILFFSYFFVVTNYIQVGNMQISSEIEENEVKLSSTDLPDKVYTFLAPNTGLFLEIY